MTARWVVDIKDQRHLEINWLPISLYFKNEPEEGSGYHEAAFFTHRLLRVMESVRATEGDAAVGELYWEYGRRIHHDGDRGFDVADALTAAGIDASHAKAFDDDSWDPAIRKAMDEGLALAGDDVGTPIIGLVADGGNRCAYFGPVITRVPPGEDSLRLWDGFMTLACIDGFWELKRGRTESPEFGERP